MSLIEEQDQLKIVGELFTPADLDDAKHCRVIVLHHPQQQTPANPDPGFVSGTTATADVTVTD